MEIKWEPEIVEILKNTGKMASRNRCEKRCRTDRPTQGLRTDVGAPGVKFRGRRGRDLGRGSAGSVSGSRWYPCNLTRPAPGGCGGSKIDPKSDLGRPRVDCSTSLGRFWRVRNLVDFRRSSGSETNRSFRTVGRQNGANNATTRRQGECNESASRVQGRSI